MSHSQQVESIELGMIYRSNKYQAYLEEKNRTIIMAGCSRGGTSALGIMAKALGLPIGSDDESVVHEDVAIMNCLRRDSGLKAIVSDRNSNHNIWGFKLPEAIFHMEKIENNTRNPIFVVVYRNPLSIAKSVYHREPTVPKNFEGFKFGLNHPMKWYMHFIEALSDLKNPCVLLEYEKILSKPDAYVKLMAEICGFDIKEEEVAKYTSLISSSGYKKIKSSIQE